MEFSAVYYSGNNTSTNSSNQSISITYPLNNSIDHSISWTEVHFEAENYTGIIYWSATRDNGSGISHYNWTDTAFPPLNGSGQGQGQDQGQSRNFTKNFYLFEGNITICVNLPSGEEDCIDYIHYYLPFSIEIGSDIENNSFSTF